ncbi:MMPL family transporter [Nocardioides caldifontis]|uniref:MMPL family transporter n=1 Tax=Nocardioides caldifontis TaxID=2588938 RepID=UPI0011DF7952|nr:MMPL family transporter [Nocardioides caldifontis]
MTRTLYRSGRWAALHPWRAVAAWLMFTALLFGLAAAVGGETQDDWNIPGTESQEGYDLLGAHFPTAGFADARVVVHSDDGRLPRQQLDELRDDLLAMPHASSVSEPRMSEDGDTALLMVAYDVQVTHPDLMGNMDDLDEAVEPTRAAGLQVEMNGGVPGTAAAPMKGQGELIGIVVALVVLVWAFGSVVAAGLPIGTAVAGLVAGSAGLTILAGAMDVSGTAPTVATMVGLGVGIDYALLMVTRHAEFLRAGLPVEEAAGQASATAGRSVVFAAVTVLVSLMGLRLADLATYSSFGFATAIAVLCVLGAALLLVPALSRFAGTRLLPRRVRQAREERTPLTARWALRVGRRPLPWAIAAATLMVFMALPALDMRTWPQDPGTQSTELTTRKAFDLVKEEYGAGANSSMTVVVDREAVTDAEVDRLRTTLADDPDVVAVGKPVTSPDGAISVVELQPAHESSHERTAGMVESVRDQLPEGALLTGDLPLFHDISEKLGDRLPVVIGFVVGVSVLLLAMVFRSVVVPVKAAVMNLLSIGGAYGVLTAVFQWGWGVELMGIDHAMPVSSWVPILIFAILFGLSMDYEVFLLSRIREHWLATGDAQGSVVRGLSDTGRVISAAAMIMVAVFLGFATEVDAVVKMLGLGMAVAVFLDATVVRMVLVPATMSLLGRWNWWLPAWMDRLLPTVDVEAAGYQPAAPGLEEEQVDEERPLAGV